MLIKEFSNPEEADYDINSGINSSYSNGEKDINIYIDKLVNLIGVLDDVTEDELQEKYGIGMDEYFYPTAETIQKVTQKISSNQIGTSR